MKTTGFALMTGCAAGFLLSAAAGGCGGVTALLPSDGGTDGQASSGSGSSSGGTASGSSSSGGVSSSSGSGGASGSSSSSSSSGGVSSSSSSGGSSSGGPDTGTIYFEQCSGSTLCASPTFDFYAGFGALSSGTQGCTVTTSGACSSYSCAGTAQNPIGDSAGTLTISGGSIAASVTVTPDPSNNYDYEAAGTLYTAGQTLTVTASGATVPACGPISVVAPGLPVLTAPAAASGAYTLSASADLNVAWSAGASAANSQIIFEAGSNDGASYFMCVWSASLGNATVPQAMLTPLTGQTTGFLIYGQYAATNFTAGAYSIAAAALPYSGGTASFE
jgi:hypothetical protein